jgi:hypothetical protein
MAVAVNVFVKDTNVPPQPIPGVVVNVYDASTLTFVTSGTTDALGKASFLLPGSPAPGTSYELRFFKSGVVFQNPKLIAVLEPVAPPNTNDFDVSGTVVNLPIATDPRMCRCTGQFVNFGGQPVRNTLVKVSSILGAGNLTKPPDKPIVPWLQVPPPSPPNILTGFQVPKVVDGKMVSVSTMEYRTDDNGKVTFDLIRNGQYYVTFAGEEDHIWPIVVPDRPSANLIDLIHPEPKTLTWDPVDAPGDSVSLSVGQTKSVKFSVLFSNFISYSAHLSHIIQFTNSDGNKADVFYDSGNGVLKITGKSVGALNVTVSVLPNLTPVRVPPYSITSAPLSVTVTP